MIEIKLNKKVAEKTATEIMLASQIYMYVHMYSYVFICTMCIRVHMYKADK